MSKKILSIDISNTNVKVMQIDLSGGKPAVEKVFMSGVTQVTGAAGVLRPALKDFSARDAYFVLSHSSTFTKRVSIPVMPEKEILQAIKWQIKEDVNFDLEKANIDFQIIGESTGEAEGRRIDLVVVAVPGDVVDELVNLSKKLGLSIKGINTPPFVMLSLLKLLKADMSKGVAVLGILNKISAFCVYKDNKLVFFRNFPIGSQMITNAMAGVFVSDKGRVELNVEQAEEIKKKVGIPGKDSADIPYGLTASQIMAMIRYVLEQVAGEIKRSLDYFNFQLGYDKPSVIYLVGGGARLKGLGEYLKNDLGIDVDVLPIPANLDCSRVDCPHDNFLQMANCLGGAFTHRNKVNLIPEALKFHPVEFYGSIALRVASITLAAVLAFSFIQIRLRVRDYKYRTKVSKESLQTYREIEALSIKINEREALYNSIMGKYLPAVYVLKEIGNITPSEIILTDLNFNRGQSALTLGGYVTVADSDVHRILSEYMTRLEGSPVFGEANLVSAEKNSSEGKQTSVFQIEVQVATV